MRALEKDQKQLPEHLGVILSNKGASVRKIYKLNIKEEEALGKSL